MEITKYVKQIRKNGYLFVGYNSIRLLGTKTSIVFERINAEYKFAVDNSLNIENCFAYNEQELAQILALSIEEVQSSIKELENMSFIKTKIIDNHKIMYMYLDNIENYFIKKQNNCEFATWDYGLKTLQQNAFNNLRFNEENKKLMQDFIAEDYEMATDEFGNPLTF